ncbi:MAG: hypothetical protein J6D10_11010, partial [Clostridia bacterium]|nr:hypothetical protein [Clostridia bacterium]
CVCTYRDNGVLIVFAEDNHSYHVSTISSICKDLNCSLERRTSSVVRPQDVDGIFRPPSVFPPREFLPDVYFIVSFMIPTPSDLRSGAA